MKPWNLIAFMSVLILSLGGCSSYEDGEYLPEDAVGTAQQHLYAGAPTGDRGRLLWEATIAVVGSANADSEDWSPATEMHATASYVSTDIGAWNSLRSAYGTLVSCRKDSDDGNNYTPCNLVYGADNAYQYECQNGSCTNNYHGGQCKAFSNLVAYRSGIFHGNNWAWKTLPADAWIASNCDYVTSGTIQAGDVLRSTSYGHSVIVARVFSSTSVMVIDSNWIDDGDGDEKVGAHAMSFSGSGIGDLDNYRVLDCVYANDCTTSCN